MELIELAFSQLGVTEIPGPDHNPKVVNYFHEIGYDFINDDETPWCSAFMNWCCMKTGYKYSGKLNARSWLEVGLSVSGQPRFGDIVVLWRKSKNSQYGHVGFYINRQGDYLNILGGNQGNMVKISAYHIAKVLDIRRPVKAGIF